LSRAVQCPISWSTRAAAARLTPAITDAQAGPIDVGAFSSFCIDDVDDVVDAVGMSAPVMDSGW
jgi:hypothetical protein